jgi:hypothetical protein
MLFFPILLLVRDLATIKNLTTVRYIFLVVFILTFFGLSAQSKLTRDRIVAREDITLRDVKVDSILVEADSLVTPVDDALTTAAWVQAYMIKSLADFEISASGDSSNIYRSNGAMDVPQRTVFFPIGNSTENKLILLIDSDNASPFNLEVPNAQTSPGLSPGIRMFNGADIGTATDGWLINNRTLQFKNDSETPRILSEDQGFYIDGGFATTESVRLRWYTDRLGVEETNIPGFLGLVYASDISANFVDESLVSKRYVDAELQDAIANNLFTPDLPLSQDQSVDMNQNDVTFSNTETDGSQTGVFISADESDPNRIRLSYEESDGDFVGQVLVGENGVSLYSEDVAAGFESFVRVDRNTGVDILSSLGVDIRAYGVGESIDLLSDKILLRYQEATGVEPNANPITTMLETFGADSVGIVNPKAFADYSGTYTDRSLVDKAHLDAYVKQQITDSIGAFAPPVELFTGIPWFDSVSYVGVGSTVFGGDGNTWTGNINTFDQAPSSSPSAFVGHDGSTVAMVSTAYFPGPTPFPLTEAFVATLATGNTVLYGDQAISFQSNDIQIDLLEGLSPNPSAGEGLRYMHDYTDYIIDFDRTIPDVGITKKLIKRGVSSPSGAEMRIVDDSDAYPFYENYPFNSGTAAYVAQEWIDGLTQDTVARMFTLDDGELYMAGEYRFTDLAGNTGLYLSELGGQPTLQLGTTNAGVGSYFNYTGSVGDWIFTDLKASPEGIRYAGDYTSSLINNPRSLTDVNTVRQLIFNGAEGDGTGYAIRFRTDNANNSFYENFPLYFEQFGYSSLEFYNGELAEVSGRFFVMDEFGVIFNGTFGMTDDNGAELFSFGNNLSAEGRIILGRNVSLQYDETTDAMTVIDQRGTPVGIEYDGDYSANLINNDRSLIDVGTMKSYLDTLTLETRPKYDVSNAAEQTGAFSIDASLTGAVYTADVDGGSFTITLDETDVSPGDFFEILLTGVTSGNVVTFSSSGGSSFRGVWSAVTVGTVNTTEMTGIQNGNHKFVYTSAGWVVLYGA